MSLVDESRFAQLKISGRLPTPKGVALEVINLTQKEDASNHDIVRLISTDPALSARVIKAANVLLGNISRPITATTDAVTVLGARALRQLVLGIALILDYRRGPCKQFNYGHFWMRSLLTGIAARRLAAKARSVSAEEIFVVGLLSQIGQLALATLYAENYGALLEQAKDKLPNELSKMESEAFGFDAMELSEAILADMKFPRIFQTLVRDHVQPETSNLVVGTREWKSLYLLHMAALMADIYLTNQDGRAKLLTKLRTQGARIAIEEAALIEIGDACARDWLEWSAVLNMGMRQLPPFTELLMQASSDAENVAAQSENIKMGSYKLRVLLVEDDRSMMALLKSMLVTEGHIVFTANHGIEALTLIDQCKPQLIITDWLMPQMDGITLCRKLRECAEWREIYLIMMTAQEDSDKLVEAFEAGADDYLVKPIIPKIFISRLRAGSRVVQLHEELTLDRQKLLRLSDELSSANEHLQLLALTDVLTSLPNRRSAMERLEQEWSAAVRGHRALSCMMIDIDHFKSINDKFGHPIGDITLKKAADILRRSARTQDVVCRVGGEEFLVICPETDIEAAYQCAERLRKSVAMMVVSDEKPILNVTVSIGVADNTGGMVSAEDLFSKADRNLYAAKHAGRNRVSINNNRDNS